MRESKLAGLSPIQPNTSSNTGNATIRGNTSNRGHGSISSKPNKIKLSIYIDKNLVDRAKTAYLLDQINHPVSWSEWVATQIENAVTQSEEQHNHGQKHKPTIDKLPTGARNQ